jgi:hypothetical protein
MGERLGRDFQKSFIGTKEWETDRQTTFQSYKLCGKQTEKMFLREREQKTKSWNKQAI